MAELEPHLAEPLRRARRFLILMSLGIACYFIFGFDLEPKADYAGLSLRARDPRYSLWALWAAWAWALLRYVQFSYQVLSRLWAEVVEDVEAEITRIVRRLAANSITAEVRRGERDGVSPDAQIMHGVQIGENSAEQITAGKLYGKPVELDHAPGIDGGRHYGTLSAYFSSRTSASITGQRVGFNLQITKWEMIRIKVRAWCYAALLLPAISDHIFPFVFVAAAFVCAMFLDHGACYAAWCVGESAVREASPLCTATICPH